MATSSARRLYPRINMRITLPFLAAIAVVAGMGVFIVTRLVAGSIQERMSNQLAESARAATNGITEVERQQLETLRTMVFTEGVGQAILDGDVASLDDALRPVAANTRTDSFVVFDVNGDVLLSLRRDNVSLEYVSAPAPTLPSVAPILSQQSDTLGDKYVDITGDPTTGMTMVYISAPVTDASGSVLGGVSVGITAQALVVRVSEQALSEVTLLHGDGSLIGSTLRGVPIEQIVLTPAAAANLLTQAESAPSLVEQTFGDALYQTLYVPLQIRSSERGLLAVSLPSNFIADRIGTSRDAFALLFSGLFLLIAIVGLLVSRSIIVPIRRLVQTSRAIREGDLSKRTNIQIPDELGELSQSFDTMTDRLVSSYGEIERLYNQQIMETARRQATLAAISDAVIVQDGKRRTIFENPAATQLQKTLKQHADAYNTFAALRNQPEALGQPQTISLMDHYLSVLSRPVSLDSGERLGDVLVFRDITALVQAEKTKDEIILQLSHELRTPLTSASGYIQLVPMMMQLTPEVDGFMQTAMRNLGTLEYLVNEAVDTSTILSGRFTINVTRFNVADLIQETMRKHQPLADERQVTITVRLETLDVWLEADQESIGHVLDHLVRNAYSYSLPGGWVEIKGEPREDRAIISVMDGGVGIETDELDKVFDRLYRGTAAQAGETDSRGLGLGLFLSKYIIEAHGGKILLASEPGVGTIVTIDLPLKQPTPQ